MNFPKLLNSFKKLRVLVIGDIILDEYIFGHAGRISREAPVMVINQKKREYKLGGAANVAQNISALGAKVHLIGVIGKDLNGEILLNLLNQYSNYKTLVDPHRITTTKTRVLGSHNHQVLRIDTEENTPLNDPLTIELIKYIKTIISQIDVIICSDYNRGTITSLLTEEILKYSLPIVANPRPETFHLYKGIDLISFNQEESISALNISYLLDQENAKTAAFKLREKGNTKYALITLGKEGMVAASENTYITAEAPEVEVYDTSGAGDTVIATIALGYKILGFHPTVFRLAAHMGAKTVKHMGVAVPTPKDLEDLHNSGY